MKSKHLRSECEAMQACIVQYGSLLPENAISDRLRHKIERNEEQIRLLEEWLESIPDAFIKNAISAYQQTSNWSQTNYKMYGYPSYQTVRKSVETFLQKSDFMERFG